MIWHSHCSVSLEISWHKFRSKNRKRGSGIMKREKGFTLIEILIVVAIIGVIAALAIPGLKKARQSAQAAGAVQALRTLTTAQILYRLKYKVYGSLALLAPEGTLDPALAAGRRNHYLFTLTLGAGMNSFSCTATPEDEPTKMKHYFVDETGVIRVNDGAPADATSPPIPR